MEEKKKIKFKDIFINFICGVAIGAGAILPGISGGVLCVVFNLYRKVMELLAHPFKSLKKNLDIFIPLGIGWLLGFFVFARLIEVCFSFSVNVSTWLFIGLILGTIPSLWKQAGEKGRNGKSHVALIVSFLILFGILLTVKYLPNLEVEVNIFWFMFAGALWGLSIVIPGMTSSSILMSLGIYRDLNAGIADFSLPVILPWIFGMAITAVLTGKLVNRLFEKHYSIAFHGVVGIVLASTLILVTFSFTSSWEAVISFAACIIGFFAAYFTEKIVPKKEEN